MRDSREIRYYTSVPKALLLFIGSAALTAMGWWIPQSGDDASFAWAGIGLFGLCTLGALIMLVMLVVALILRIPLLMIDATGITSSTPFAPWVKILVPWPEVARISIRNRRGVRESAIAPSATFQVQTRNRDRYSSQRAQQFVDRYTPTFKGTVISVPFAFLFVWASRQRRASLLRRIQQTFAPEISQYDIEVDEQE